MKKRDKKIRRIASALGAVLICATAGITAWQLSGNKNEVPDQINDVTDAVAGSNEVYIETVLQETPTDGISKLPMTNGTGFGYWPVKYVEAEKAVDEETGELAVIPKWDDMGYPERFSELTVGEAVYTARALLAKGDDAISLIADEIGEFTLSGYDIYTDTSHSETVKVYSIRGISEKCAVCVDYTTDNSDKYYVFANTLYTPATLGEFIDDTDMAAQLTFGEVYYDFYDYEEGRYRSVVLEAPDAEYIWDLLLSDRECQNVADMTKNYRATMSISVSLPLLGYKNVTISINSEEGYVMTNILSSLKVFEIGVRNTAEFEEYVLGNCKGYEIVYVYDVPDGGDDLNGDNVPDDFVVEMTTQVPDGTVAEMTTSSRGKGTTAAEEYIPDADTHAVYIEPDTELVMTSPPYVPEDVTADIYYETEIALETVEDN